MQSLNLKTINDFAARRGIIAGVCDASSLARENYAGFVPFVSGDIKKRTDPAAALVGARGVVVVGVPWEVASVGGLPMGAAELSSLGQTTDYHKRIKAILLDLAETLRTSLSDASQFRYKILVDSPGLDERALAVRAGLGFCGWHGLVISREFGTRFNIGCLLTTAPPPVLPSDASLLPPNSAYCVPDCRRCAAACPTGALSADAENRYDVRRCISYLTQKNALTPEEEKLLSNQLYGCDICQDACPHNPARGKTFIDPARWAVMTDGDFAREYGHTAMLWQGAERLRRNARITEKKEEPT